MAIRKEKTYKIFLFLVQNITFINFLKNYYANNCLNIY